MSGSPIFGTVTKKSIFLLHYGFRMSGIWIPTVHGKLGSRQLYKLITFFMDQVFTVMGVTALCFNCTKDRVVFGSEQCVHVVMIDQAYWCCHTFQKNRLFMTQNNVST